MNDYDNENDRRPVLAALVLVALSSGIIGAIVGATVCMVYWS